MLPATQTTVYQLPHIRTAKDCEREFPDIITFSLLNTYEKFDQLYYKVYYAICACVEIPECVGYKIRFKFYADDKVSYELSMPKFLLNMNAWRPLIELNTVQKYYREQIKVMDESFIIGTMMSDTLRMGLESRVLNVLDEYGISFNRISELLKTVIERYQEASLEFAMIDPSSIITYESVFLLDYMKSEKIRELNNLQIPQTIQTADVEILLKQKTAELLEEMKKTKNPIWYIAKAGNHIKPKQIQELFISYGQIPDINGMVIPYTMKGNGFSTGYADPITFYIAATGARMSGIMNKEHMGEAGYLARNLILLSRTLTMNNTMFNCGTQHLLRLHVKNSDFLRRLENRWYAESPHGELKLIHYSDCKHLIGKTIYIRSIITCAGKDTVCHMCYGRDSHLVMNMPGMAIYNTEVYSEPVSQNILSTKHLLFTAANRISYNKAFSKYFIFSSGDVYLKDRDAFGNDVNLNDLYIRIEDDNVIPVNKNDMVGYNTFGNHVESPFYIYNAKTKEYIAIEITNYESMFIDATSMKQFKFICDKTTGKYYYEISFNTISAELEGRLLSVDIKNNGAIDVLFMIMDLVNKNASKYENYHDLAQDFFEKLIDAGIRTRHVQAEIILNRLIRNPENLYERPAFDQFQEPASVILTLNKALLNTKAPTVALSYQEVKRQILNDQLFDEKHGSSYLDAQWSDTIDTRRLKMFAQRVEYKRKQRAQAKAEANKNNEGSSNQ